MLNDNKLEVIKKNFILKKNTNLKKIKIKQIKELKKNLNEFGVAIFENQKLNYKDLIKISDFLGKSITHPYLDKIKRYPKISKIVKKKNDKKMFGGDWHTDSSYLIRPPKFTILYSIKVPGSNLGGTHFACLYNSYNNLNNKLKKKLEKIFVIHSSNTKLYNYRKKDHNEKVKKELLSFHKLIQKQTNNDKTIYFSPGHFKYFIDKKQKKISKYKELRLLKILKKEIFKKKNIYTYNWKKNSLVIWNNQRVIHKPQNNFTNKERIMLRLNSI